MKCIKTIKKTKEREIGEYIRTTDTDAEIKVNTGYWAYSPKSEYKEYFGKSKKTEQVTEQVTEQMVTKRGKNKKV